MYNAEVEHESRALRRIVSEKPDLSSGRSGHFIRILVSDWLRDEMTAPNSSVNERAMVMAYVNF